MNPARILAAYELTSRPNYWPSDVDRVAAYVGEQIGGDGLIVEGEAVGRWQYLYFDSEIFGLPMGRVDWVAAAGGATSNRGQVLAQLVAEADARGVEQLSFRLSASDGSLMQACEESGFRTITVFTGLARWIHGDLAAPVSGWRTAVPGDLMALSAITDESFAEGTRFHLDPGLAPGARLLHRRWIDNCLTGQAADRVLVGLEEGEVVGYITGQIDNKSHLALGQKRATIGLFAVRRDRRGRGIGSRLLEALLASLAAEGVDWVEVGTEATNCLAINAYFRAGFNAVQSGMTLHRWRDH